MSNKTLTLIQTMTVTKQFYFICEILLTLLKNVPSLKFSTCFVSELTPNAPMITGKSLTARQSLQTYKFKAILSQSILSLTISDKEPVKSKSWLLGGRTFKIVIKLCVPGELCFFRSAAHFPSIHYSIRQPSNGLHLCIP